jgi:hypothetical protein
VRREVAADVSTRRDFFLGCPMNYQTFADNSLTTMYEGVRGVLARDDALQYDEWKLDSDGVTPDPGPTRQNQTDIRFTVGIAIALALPMLIGMGIYIATTALLNGS